MLSHPAHRRLWPKPNDSPSGRFLRDPSQYLMPRSWSNAIPDETHLFTPPGQVTRAKFGGGAMPARRFYPPLAGTKFQTMALVVLPPVPWQLRNTHGVRRLVLPDQRQCAIKDLAAPVGEADTRTTKRRLRSSRGMVWPNALPISCSGPRPSPHRRRRADPGPSGVGL